MPLLCNPIPVANEAHDDLTAGMNLPDLSGVAMPVFPALEADTFLGQPSIKLEDLTTGQTGGSGVFDRLMMSVTAHLDRERSAGRITNNDFAKSYVEFSGAALQAALQFVLTKDQTHWQALAAQTAAKLAQVELVNAQVRLEQIKAEMNIAVYQAEAAKAQAATMKMQLATARVEYCTAEFQLNEMLPKQSLILTAQKEQLEAQIDNLDNQTANLLPEQVRLTKSQADASVYSNTFLLPKQADQLAAMVKVAQEQHETQRAQTLDTRSDGVTPVTGTLGKQKDLHTRQILSYKQDAQLKAARPFVDAWITMKTIDEGTLPPVGFNNANLDQILTTLRAGNDL
jgi:hypothetical protein